MAETHPGFDTKEQHAAYVSALESELSVLKMRKNPRAKEVEAELAKHKPHRGPGRPAKAESESD